ncbi:MAG: bifunctional folylpolyglutamate synthase/dihydrofolate synthase [bacterium]|nr:bifunctional folylpolyglutamate synthase/dihydrofolate synthase [bacterium]
MTRSKPVSNPPGNAPAAISSELPATAAADMPPVAEPCPPPATDLIIEAATNSATLTAESVASEPYREALDYLYQRINYEKTFSSQYNPDNFRLDRMRHLASLLGDPHLQYPVIHVAGTKGKGTVSQLLAAGLTACGLKTGLYTSPHLLALEERFQIDQKPATAQQIVELVDSVKEAAECLERQGSGRPTFFELTTAMGFLHFARSKVDCVVLEVGLGGRLDSTNICSPTACVITSIGMDHQKQLGNTISAIASEKAGIIKSPVPVICSARHPEAQKVITRRAQDWNAPLRLIGRDFSVDWRALSSRSEQPTDAEIMPPECRPPTPVTRPQAVAEVDFKAEPGWESQRVCSRLLGRHQADNFAAAIATLGQLSQLGWKLDPSRWSKALGETQPPARLQLVGNLPIRIVDTAHNLDSIAAGMEAVGLHFPDKECTAIFASSRDKDYRGMLRQIAATAKNLVLTQYLNNPRALPLSELQQAAREELQALGDNTNCHLWYSETPAQAWELSLRITESSSGLVLATGSFFLAAELLATADLQWVMQTPHGISSSSPDTTRDGCEPSA